MYLNNYCRTKIKQFKLQNNLPGLMLAIVSILLMSSGSTGLMGSMVSHKTIASWDMFTKIEKLQTMRKIINSPLLVSRQ